MNKTLLIAVCLSLARRSPASAEGLLEPQNVHFYSLNLKNQVRWTPGERSLNETVYTVEYAIYGDAEEGNSEQVRWRPVEECTSTQHTECDVSQQTVHLQEEYYARVKAASPQTQSVWTESRTRFRPMTDTVLGPPFVDMMVVQNYVNITLKGPFRWKTQKTKKEKSLWKIFPHMIYNVSVYNSKSKHTQSFSVKTSTLTLGPLEPSTQVCVVVFAQSQSLPLTSISSERMCAETLKGISETQTQSANESLAFHFQIDECFKHSAAAEVFSQQTQSWTSLCKYVFKDQLLTAMLGGVLPSALCLCVLAVLGGLIRCYITDHRQKLPKSTDMVHVSEKLQTLQPERPQTIILNLISTSGEKCKQICSAPQLPAISVSDTQAPPPDAESPAGYAQQHVRAPASADVQAECSEMDDLQPWPQEPEQSEMGDYGIVLPGPCEIGLYRTQGDTTELQQTENEEEEVQIFLDWSPDTRELKIPLMDLLGSEKEDQTDAETERDEVTLLPKVILRQCSEESSEQDDDFTKMERNWGLIIHSSTD